MTLSQPLQQPAMVAMIASGVAHGVLLTGFALAPASGKQPTKKPLRVISLLQPSATQPSQPNQVVDPNAPPPAPGVAGLPLNITTPGSLAELPITSSPNPAFDPFSSSIVELPSSLQNRSSLPQPSVVARNPRQPTNLSSANAITPSASKGSGLSDQDFRDWLNGKAELPNLPTDPGSSKPLAPPSVPTNPVANNVVPPKDTSIGGVDSAAAADPGNLPPAQTIKRFVAYDYPKTACPERLEGQGEYRIWVSAQATPVVSDITKSTNSDLLDRVVKSEAKKYKITAADANKLVVLPFDFKYSKKVCEAKSNPATPAKPNTESSPPAIDKDTPTLKPAKPTGELDPDPKDTLLDQDKSSKDGSTPSPSLVVPQPQDQPQPLGTPIPNSINQSPANVAPQPGADPDQPSAVPLLKPSSDLGTPQSPTTPTEGLNPQPEPASPSDSGADAPTDTTTP
ncbi:MAG: hypothetical protein HC851_20825 [Acaryochloris sp. RU_4_1]|nr:hypothetical protein [Acaryochloris sp. RU_4_1]NJR54510.1 hypothetical protein [Acaryochloris sp. CRU_2_0]